MKNLMKKKPILLKKLQKGLGKYKGKLPFKCFNCHKIGHFQAKCPYPKEDSEDEDEKNKQYKKKGKFHNKKNYKEKNNFYSKEENNSSSKISDDEVIFLGIEESNEIEEIEHKEESEDEAYVNMEEELLKYLNH